MMPVHPTYDALVAPVRARLGSDRRLAALLDPDLQTTRLHLYLMQLHGWWVQLNGALRGSMRRAGEHCRAAGLARAGDALVERSRSGADKDVVWLRDLRTLVAIWNAEGRPAVTRTQFLEAAASPGMKRLLALHEGVIASGEAPAQLALVAEMAAAWEALRPALLARCQGALAPTAERGLTSLLEPAACDPAFDQLAELVAAGPQVAARLAHLGGAAAGAYLDFLGDCLDAVADPIAGTALPRRAPGAAARTAW